MEPSDEIAALWCMTFGEPPPVKADFNILSRILVQCVKLAPPYRPRPLGGGTAPSEPPRP